MESLLENQEEKKFELSKMSIAHILETAKWAKFIAIVGFVVVAFLLVLAFFMGFFLPSINSAELENLNANEMGGLMSMMGPMLSVIYILIALLYFFPVLFLFNFSNMAMKAIKQNDNELLNSSFNQIRRHFKFIGILTLIGVLVYAIIFIGSILGGALGAMF